MEKMMSKYKSHAAELKFKVALEAAKNEKTVNQIASEYSVAPSCVTDWKKQLLSEGREVFCHNKRVKPKEPCETVEHLQQIIGKLTTQLEWLKKKLNHSS